MGTWIPTRSFADSEFVTSTEMNEVSNNLDVLKSNISDTGEIVVGPTGSFRNLHLRTHPDQDVAASRLFLNHADEVVMDTGARIGPLGSLVFDITVSGPGGLDTGAEAASTWYEAYIIRKSTDGTVSTLLHQAKDDLLDEQNTTINTGNFLKSTSSLQAISQGFQIDTSGPCYYVDVAVRGVGTIPAGQFYLELRSDDGTGKPSATVLATSDKYDQTWVSVVATAYWVRFIFRTPATLTSGVQYHIVMQSTQAVDASNHVSWNGAGSDTYATRGQQCTYNGTVWAAVSTKDQSFKVYIRRNDIALTMPSGYDQSCRVGYVYNDGSSNFRMMKAHDHLVRQNVSGGLNSGNLDSATLVGQTLIDLSAFVPNTAVITIGLAANQNGAGAVYCAAVPDFGNTVNSASAPRRTFAAAESGKASFIGESITETQAVYAVVSAGIAVVYVDHFRWS